MWLRRPQRDPAERRPSFALALGFVVGRRAAGGDRLLLPGRRLHAAPGGRSQDYPLLQGIFLVITLAVLAANLIADFVVRAPRPAHPHRRPEHMAITRRWHHSPRSAPAGQVGPTRHRRSHRAGQRRRLRFVANQGHRPAWSSSASSRCSRSSARGSRRTTRSAHAATRPAARPSARTGSAPPTSAQDIFTQLLVGTRGVDGGRLHRRAGRDDAVRRGRRDRGLPRRRPDEVLSLLPTCSWSSRRCRCSSSSSAACLPRAGDTLLIALDHRASPAGPGAPGCCGPRRCRCAGATSWRRPAATGERTWRIIALRDPAEPDRRSSPPLRVTVIYAIVHLRSRWPSSASRAPRDWNWGTMLFWAQSQQALAQGAWWWFVPPGLASRCSAPRWR